jgi:hypothetical protein
MKPQRAMMRKKGRGYKPSRGAGSRRGGREAASAQAIDSSTPATNITGATPKLTLKLSLGEQNTQHIPNIDFGYNQQQQAEQEDVVEQADDFLPVANATSLRTRTGRVVKKPQNSDYLYSGEMDAQVELQTVDKVDSKYSESNFEGRSSPRKLNQHIVKLARTSS